MITRRSVAALLGISPLAGKEMADKTMQQMAGVVGAPGEAVAPHPLRMHPSECSQGSNVMPHYIQRRLAHRIPSVFAQLESLTYDSVRTVHVLDHDIASKKSWSLSAKVTFQRQRTVAQVMQEATEEKSAWGRIKHIAATLGLEGMND